MSNTHPPDGYPAGHHHPSHHQQHNHQPYYAPPHQQPAPPSHMYQAQPQHQQPNNYYTGGAPPVGAPQIPPAGYYSPTPPQQQYANQQQYGQPPPPGCAPHQPYGQPQYTNTTYHPQHQQPQQQYPASATSNNFAPPSQPTQYQQLPPPGSTYPQAYGQGSHMNMSHQNGHPYGQQYAAPPSNNNNNGTNANGNAYAQQPAMYNNPSYSQQQYPCQQHRPSSGYSSGVPSAQPQYQAPLPPPQQPHLYPGQSYLGATTSSSGSGNGTEGVLLNQGSYPGASAPSQSPGNSISISGMQKVCASGLPIIEGDPCRAPIKLRIEEKIMEASGDSFYVTDAKKKILYNVDGSRTPDQHKILKSAKGRPLLQMRQFSTVAKKIVITNMNSEPVATLEKARVDSNTHKRIDATIHCNNTRFIIAGNSQASSFKVENARMDVVAEIARASRSMKKIFSGQDSYTADVTAGSPAFLVMIVVAIDEIFCDG